jgi:hypothetical protein
LQFGIDAARRFELEAAGAGYGDIRALDAVARQHLKGMGSTPGERPDELAANGDAAIEFRCVLSL